MLPRLLKNVIHKIVLNFRSDSKEKKIGGFKRSAGS